jgi:hypothetical protein
MQHFNFQEWKYLASLSDNCLLTKIEYNLLPFSFILCLVYRWFFSLCCFSFSYTECFSARSWWCQTLLPFPFHHIYQQVVDHITNITTWCSSWLICLERQCEGTEYRIRRSMENEWRRKQALIVDYVLCKVGEEWVRGVVCMMQWQ